MKNFWKYTLATIVGIIILNIILIIILVSISSSAISKSEKAEKISPNTVLYLNFDRQMYDKAPSDIYSLFQRTNFEDENPQGLNTILRCINKAKEDDNIKGIFIETLGVSGGLAMADEIRNALIDFKNSDTSKFIITYSKSLTQTAYYLTSISDMIFVNPAGNIAFQGLSSEILFYKDLFDKLGVEIQVFRPDGCKFKSAVEPFIMNKMSEANKEQIQQYLNTTWDNMTIAISTSRNIPNEKLNTIADNLLIRNANDAVKFGLIDKAAPYDEAINYIKQLTNTPNDKKLKLIKIDKYNNVKLNTNKEYIKDKIAVIYAQGNIIDGKGNDIKIGDITLSKLIRKAREDKDIKAVVFRVNSPGGSALASEIILREIELTKKEKPVIASFGTYAASGGYYISCLCDKIVCEKYCLTGSIGVFGMIPNAKKLLNDKIGITSDYVTTNKNSRSLSIIDKISPDMNEYIMYQINDVYTNFIEHVAKGRSMTTQDVDAIGQGRIWSGTNALEIGLVDEIGGLQDAIKLAAKTANLDKYKITTLPKEKDIYMIISDLINDKNDNIKNSQLGILYPYYKTFKYITEMSEIQASLPFEILINN